MTYKEKTEMILREGKDLLDDLLPKDFNGKVEFLEKVDPPSQWVVSELSKLNSKQYSYVPITVMEFVCNYVFGHVNDEIISQYITQDKSRFAVTTTVLVTISSLASSPIGGALQFVRLYGNATEIAPTLEHLQLATPLSRKKAVGNALRSKFALFGKYLNWEASTMRDESAGEQSSPDGPTDNDAEFNRLVTAIKEAKTKAEAQAIIDGAGSFKNALPFNSEVKASINSKPE